MIKVILNGACGKMGQIVSDLCQNNSSYEIVAGIDSIKSKSFDFPIFDSLSSCNLNADVIIDFSRPEALDSILDYCKKNSTPVVICSTGFSDDQLKKIEECSKYFPIFKSANMSFGINVIKSVLENLSQKLFNDFDIEIIEKHHNQKVDSPSGTALLLADSIKDSLDEDVNYVCGRNGFTPREKSDIGIHSIRGGSIVGEHEVIFSGKSEVISFKHIAESREVFGSGALIASKFIVTKKNGLYSMDDILKNQ